MPARNQQCLQGTSNACKEPAMPARKKSYNATHKQVMEYLEPNSNREAERRFHVVESSVSNWKKQKY